MEQQSVEIGAQEVETVQEEASLDELAYDLEVKAHHHSKKRAQKYSKFESSPEESEDEGAVAEDEEEQEKELYPPEDKLAKGELHGDGDFLKFH